jgi:hypothetical protein
MKDDVAAQRRATREHIVIEHMESENVQEWDRTMATFSHPRYELIPTGEVFDGTDDVMAYWLRGRSVFTDQRNELISLRHADDSVIIEFWLRGTHLGGRNPTGRAFECRMCAIFEFDDNDLMTAERVYFDQATITAQLTGA